MDESGIDELGFITSLAGLGQVGSANGTKSLFDDVLTNDTGSHRQPLPSLDQDKELSLDVSARPIMCQKHQDELVKYYCRPCDQVLCKECLAIDHPKGPLHEHEYLADAAPKLVSAGHDHCCGGDRNHALQ